MRQVREIIRLKSSSACRTGRSPEPAAWGWARCREYCRRVQQAAQSWPLPAEWDDAQLEAWLFPRVGDLVGVPRRRAIRFLAADESAYVSGATIKVTGGR